MRGCLRSLSSPPADPKIQAFPSPATMRGFMRDKTGRKEKVDILTYVLVKEHGVWFIDDILYAHLDGSGHPKATSFKSYLKYCQP